MDMASVHSDRSRGPSSLLYSDLHYTVLAQYSLSTPAHYTMAVPSSTASLVLLLLVLMLCLAPRTLAFGAGEIPDVSAMAKIGGCALS